MAYYEIRLRASPGDIDVSQARWEAYARDPAGDIARDMTRRADNVQDAMNVPEDTGTLKATLRNVPDFGSRLPAVEVTIGIPGLTDYLGYVIDGTGPHEITPNTRKALRFVGSGGVVFAARVNHPGTRPNDFLNEALPAALI